MDGRQLIELFQLAAEARQAERRGFEAYGGYSWGYVGAPLIDAAHEAEAKAERALEEYVDSRIELRLAKSLKDPFKKY